MKRRELKALGKRLGLELRRIEGGQALHGRLGGAEVLLAQLETTMGPDPSPRPITELRVVVHGAARGGLLRADPDRSGDTGDARFDQRFMWWPAPGQAAGVRPSYLDSPDLRQALLALDAAVASAVGHLGVPLFQIDHLDSAARMLFLCHLPSAALCERALRLLLELAAACRGSS